MALLGAKPVSMPAAQVCADLGVQPANGGGLDFTVTEFSTDTRTIGAGSCFIALKGANFNGNTYAKQAAEKGAVMCILSEVPADDPCVPYLLVEDTVKAYGMLAKAHLSRMKQKGLRVVAVTGSSGKTTVKDMTAQVLSSGLHTYCTEGNHNNHIGLPYTILHMPAETEVAVLEMGMNHKGEIAYLSGIGQPDFAIVTNIGSAHIGNLGSQENIFLAKMEITAGMDAQGGQLILPLEDAWLKESDRIPLSAEQLRYTSLCETNTALWAEQLHETANDIRFMACTETEQIAVRIPMIGRHNASNGLLAMEAGICCGLPLADCAAALADFVPSAMRSERATIGNCTLIRDYYNANPEAMAASLQALEILAGDAKKIVVLGNMNELGDCAAARHQELGARCKAIADAAFFCGVNHGDFAAGYGKEAEAYEAQDDMIAAMALVMPDYRDEKCCILVKGSRGMHMEKAAEALEQLMK